jgi:hypothetical protein
MRLSRGESPVDRYYPTQKFENAIAYHFLIFHTFMRLSQIGINSLKKQYNSRDKNENHCKDW